MKTTAPNTATKSAPAKRRAGAKNRSEPMPQSARRIAEPDPAAPASEAAPPAPEPAARPSHPAPRAPAKSGGLDGFRVEADTAHQRLDIILDRPPLNVITMNPARAVARRLRSGRCGQSRARHRAARGG
jgi:hypothetical protein